MSDTYRKESKKDWCRDARPNTEDIKLGCLQRIADATEIMAKEYQSLINRAKWAEERAERYRKDAERAARSNAALRGVIKRMKKKGATP